MAEIQIAEKWKKFCPHNNTCIIPPISVPFYEFFLGVAERYRVPWFHTEMNKINANLILQIFSLTAKLSAMYIVDQLTTLLTVLKQ